MSFISGKHQIFYINSRNRISGTNSDFQYKIALNSNLDFNKVCVLQALIPKSYYLIQANKNTFTLTEGLDDVIITVPVGNYNRRSFQTVITGLLNSSSPNNWTYSILFPNENIEGDTGKYTFVVVGNDSQPSFTFASYVYEQLGFEPNSVNTFVADQLNSKNVIKLQKEDSVFIHSNIITSANGEKNVLQEIFAASGESTYSNIVFKCSDIQAYSKDFNGKNNGIFTFTITDENREILDLNGQNIVITIVVYKNQEDYFRMIKGFIKLRTLQNNNTQK